MINESLPPAGVLGPAAPASSGLDPERWPRWMREAFANQPGIKAPTNSGVEPAPARAALANVRVLSRVPSHS